MICVIIRVRFDTIETEPILFVMQCQNIVLGDISRSISQTSQIIYTSRSDFIGIVYSIFFRFFIRLVSKFWVIIPFRSSYLRSSQLLNISQ